MTFSEIPGESAFSQAIASIESQERLLVVGQEKEKTLLLEQLTFDDRSQEDILEAAQDLRASSWFIARKREYQEDLKALQGQWPATVSEAKFSLDKSLWGTERQQVTCLNLRVKESWHIPAHLHYGGWNDCPAPEAHCALWRDWQRDYGAHIVGISHDVIEAYVKTPPQTKAEAMMLAEQHYLYCYDIVDQGVETLARLAASLQGAHVWYFWWD